MLRMKFIAGAAALSLMLATTALAQPGFGPGGPGGGPGGRRMGMPNSAAALIAMPEVQKELKLTDEQKQQCGDLVSDMQQQMREARERMMNEDPQELSPEEMDDRRAEMAKQTEALARTADEKLATLLDESQRERLHQLHIQRDGFRALLRPDVSKRLALSEEQLEKLRDLQEDSPPMSFAPEKRQQPEIDALAILTEDQHATFKTMKGAEFKFPEMPFGRGGGPMQQERKLLKQFDKDDDGRLNTEERKAARAFVKSNPNQGGPGGPRGPGGPGGRGGRVGGDGFGPPGGGMREAENEPPKPGPKVSIDEVKPSEAALYEESVLRMLFLEFESSDWEDELADFYRSDVDVPAALTVDGKKYPGVGVHFRGASSYFGVSKGSKRSLNISLDHENSKQRLYDYKSLNLLNAHEDPTFLHTVLYLYIARQYIPAPRANFVKVVINGESWGVYVSAQQFDKQFIAEHFPSTRGTRWKAPGSPQGRAGLEYLGDDAAPYKTRFEIKSGDDEASWQALINLCKVLNQTPTEQLEEALQPILDIEGTLWFLALDNALINSDGYWTRASDYCMYLDEAGKFHIFPHDANETMQAPSGPGMGGGPRGGGGAGGGVGGGDGRDGRSGRGVELDPLIGLDDASKPLRSKLLKDPALQARYLAHVRTIAEQWLEWSKLESLIKQSIALIDKELESDTRKLTSYAAFQRSIDPQEEADDQPREGRGRMSLRSFVDQRRSYLLNYPAIKALATEANSRGDQ